MALLTLETLHLNFGGVAALSGVTLEVNADDFFAIIGPNGAGKTSIFNCISGIYTPSRGRIVFNGQDITRVKPHRRAHLRIARTFQNLALFRGMTVLDNVKIGRHILLRSGVLACGVYYGRAAREERAHRATIEREIIDLLELQDIRHKIVGTLPYGLQKRVELARALARHGALHPLRQADEAPHGGDDRARHGRRDGDLRSGGRARFRAEDRRGRSRPGPGGSRGDQGVPGRGLRGGVGREGGEDRMLRDRGSSAGFAGATIPGGRLRKGGGAPLRGFQADPVVIKAYLGEDFEVA